MVRPLVGPSEGATSGIGPAGGWVATWGRPRWRRCGGCPLCRPRRPQSIVRAMHEVALADGMHDAERVMLRGFYDSCQQEAQAMTSFDDLISMPFDAAGAIAM